MLTKSKDSAANHLRVLIPFALMHRTRNLGTIGPSLFPSQCQTTPISRMRLSLLLLLFLTALASSTPTLVHCRLLPPSPSNAPNAPHHPLKLLPFLITLVIPEKPNTNRVLIQTQFQTMSSGPSRRGSGH
ncbi:hypothetical protein VNO80_21471 [Phaseolus coccineus]|uniref:Uncharacterized protein n=1 Tax=Phaseolus coccineus TaxID=3886 RepID=A0AAN9M369_PHACN